MFRHVLAALILAACASVPAPAKAADVIVTTPAPVVRYHYPRYYYPRYYSYSYPYSYYSYPYYDSYYYPSYRSHYYPRASVGVRFGGGRRHGGRVGVGFGF
jgi:hypothetical protein